MAQTKSTRVLTRSSPFALLPSFAFSQNSRLKKTLSSAGLYPAPDVAKVGARLKTQATGSMAAFSSGASGAVLTKGGGDAM